MTLLGWVARSRCHNAANSAAQAFNTDQYCARRHAEFKRLDFRTSVTCGGLVGVVA
jgi:hypothetical protein